MSQTAILVIDDDPVFRKLISTLLAQRGHEVVEATRLKEAEKLLARRSFDLLVCDGLLPDGEGARWLRERRAQLPKVVFCSAFYRSPREQRELQATTRADALLRKPVQLDEVGRTVDRLLGKAGANVPGVQPAHAPEVRRSPFGEISTLLLNTLVGDPA